MSRAGSLTTTPMPTTHCPAGLHPVPSIQREVGQEGSRSTCHMEKPRAPGTGVQGKADSSYPPPK